VDEMLMTHAAGLTTSLVFQISVGSILAVLN
jgi:hypothetical protein